MDLWCRWPKKNLKAYQALARKAGKVWREYGALEFREFVADDVKPGKWDVLSAERQAQGR